MRSFAQLLLLICVLAISTDARALEVELSAPEQACIMMDEQKRSSRLICTKLDERLQNAARELAISNDAQEEYVNCFELGILIGCATLSEDAFEEKRKETHLPALLFAERACRKGDIDACDAAYNIIKAMPVLQHRARILKAVCLKGSQNACEDTPTQRPPKSAMFACIGLSQTEFSSLAECEEADAIVKEAALIYAIAEYDMEYLFGCYEIGDGEACTSLAFIELDPKTDETEFNDGANLWLTDRACRLGHKSACTDRVWNMADMSIFGPDRSVFVRLCKSGQVEACQYAPAAPLTSEQKRKRKQTYWAVDFFNSIEN